MSRIIYDFGANNGDDIPYYLLRAERVVAVEANVDLARGIAARFVDEIADGRVIVENVVLDVTGTAATVPFHIHRSNHVLSQFPPPDNPDEFTVVDLPARAPRDILREHGEPYYVKIDVEHYDAEILRDLFANGFRPPYISAELHSIEVFCLLVALGGYTHFKLLDGSSVVERYGSARLATAEGTLDYSFPYHSAGPFGDDIAGPWFTADAIIEAIAFAQLGWKDLHATVQPGQASTDRAPVLPHVLRLAKRALREVVRGR